MEQIPLEEVYKRLSNEESFTANTVVRVVEILKRGGLVKDGPSVL